MEIKDFEWKAVYNHCKKVEPSLNDYEVNDVIATKDIGIFIPDMENEYLHKEESEDFKVYSRKEQFDIEPLKGDILYFERLNSLYSVDNVEDKNDCWCFTIKRFLASEDFVYNQFL